MKPTTISNNHVERVKTELRNAGVSRIGLMKFTSRYIPQVIHEDEHIEAIVFGRHREIEGGFGFIEGMLVATDRRILFVDHRPGFLSMDEISYDVVSGVHVSNTGLYSSVTLFTKVANYTISFSKRAPVERFASCIEKRLMHVQTPVKQLARKTTVIGADTIAFLNTHEVAVISTLDRTWNVSGAVVYYIFKDDYLYFLTKQGTRKSSNILANQQVAMTIYDEDKLQTVQLQGIAEIETDENMIAYVLHDIVRLRPYASGDRMPPVMSIHHGEFAVFRITPTHFSLLDFNH